MSPRRFNLLVPIVLLLAFVGQLHGQTAAVETGRLEEIQVHGPSLEANLLEVSADRPVTVYLPPSYDQAKSKRYPVLYLLHGIGDSNRTWMNDPGNWQNIEDVLDRTIVSGTVAEMIVVMPDAGTWSPGGIYFGSFYTNSPVTGGWEDFIVRDLVAYIDEHYRTLAAPESRGVAGHSMGGYASIKLSMKHPDVFGAAYGMNSATLGWGGDLSPANAAFARALAVDEVEGLMRDVVMSGEVFVPAIICVAQAWSPNPDRPPFFADLPFKLLDGQLEPAQPAHEQWSSNMPLRMLNRYADNLRKLRGLRFDSGVEDEYTHIVLTNRRLSQRLTRLGIEHQYEEYNGDHRNRLWGRHGRVAADVLPWFSSVLSGSDLELRHPAR